MLQVIPIVIFEAAAEGFAILRRLSTAYRFANGVTDLADLTGLTHDKESKHERIPEIDDPLLYVLGVSILRSLNKYEVSDADAADRMRRVAVAALDSHGLDVAGAHPRSVIEAYIHSLGMAWQTEDSSVYDFLVKQTLNETQSYSLFDPWWEMLKSPEVITVSDKAIIEQLGMSQNIFRSVIATKESDETLRKWARAITKATKFQKVFKSTTSLSVLTAGAASLVDMRSPFIRVGEDYAPTAPNIQTSLLYFLPETPPPPHSSMPSNISLTREMVELASRQMMVDKGYIQDENRNWVRTTQARVTVEKDAKGAGHINVVKTIASSSATSVFDKMHGKSAAFARLLKIKKLSQKGGSND
jgi:hypothetical protein